MTVGELIKTSLKKRGMNQAQLAEISNITPAQISRIISGERGASIDTLLVLADALGVRREDMLRAAAGLHKPETKDEWVEEIKEKTKLIPESIRPFFSRFLDMLLDESTVPPYLRDNVKRAKEK